MNSEKFTCPLTGLPFSISESEDGYSYVSHPITKEEVPIYLETEHNLICIPAAYFGFIGLVSLSDAARECGVSKQALSRAFAKGHIDGVKIGSTLLLDLESVVENYANRD